MVRVIYWNVFCKADLYDKYDEWYHFCFNIGDRNTKL